MDGQAPKQVAARLLSRPVNRGSFPLTPVGERVGAFFGSLDDQGLLVEKMAGQPKSCLGKTDLYTESPRSRDTAAFQWARPPASQCRMTDSRCPPAKGRRQHRCSRPRYPLPASRPTAEEARHGRWSGKIRGMYPAYRRLPTTESPSCRPAAGNRGARLVFQTGPHQIVVPGKCRALELSAQHLRRRAPKLG